MSHPTSEALLLARLLELPLAEREEFLREACAANSALARRLEARVRTEPFPGPHSSASPFGAVRAFESALNSVASENSGARIGPYKLLEKIGEGGFGVVWMAEQQEPIKRRVALKIVKVGMDTEEVIGRFEAERQALALMEHPNIAHVLDAGATDTGRPFFVMELVRGVAITRYCDENRLSAESRLRLFIAVCQAVQHAHQKGIIHRDLKPSNILVTQHDGVPVPKIIDFGIAKATGVQLTERTFFTQFHAFIGTPAYTSPEQMEMSGLDVDTRTDIYSLGVLLYELLTGQPPFDSVDLVKSGLEAMRLTIRETDPPRPSQCLGTLTEENRSSVANRRGTDPAKLSVLLRGDLDWIAMRCLEKDRTRRYESATSLAADVERHLSDGVVEARPPSRIYQTTKFIRRHRIGVAAFAAVAITLIAGLIVSSTLFVQERAARSRTAIAERQEAELRKQAEVDRGNEVKRAARTALELATRFLADGRVGDGIAYLVYAIRKDPGNTTLAPRLASALTRHNFLLPEGGSYECGSRILRTRFTMDGRSIYVGTEDGVLRVFDAGSGILQKQISLGHRVLLGGWEFARNNDSVFTVRFADNTFGAFDIHTGLPRWTPHALDERVWHDSEAGRGHGTGISPDGRYVYANAHDRFWIWDASTGDIVLHQAFERDQPVGGCDITTDGAQVAVTVGSSVKRWTLPDGNPVENEITRIGRSAQMVRYSPSGGSLAVAGIDTGIKIFDTLSGKPLHNLAPIGYEFGATSVSFASETCVVAVGSGASGSWNLETGEFKSIPIAAGTDLLSTSFDMGGRRILMTAADGFVRVGDVQSGGLVAEPTWRQHGSCAALAPDGARVVVGTSTGTVQRFRIGRGAGRPLVIPRVLQRMPLVFLPDSPSRLLWMKTLEARVLDTASGQESAGGFAYPAPVSVQGWLSFDSPLRADLKFAVVKTEGAWQSWELGPSGVMHVAVLQGAPDGGSRVRFSSRGDLVALVSSPERDRFGIWNLRTGARAGPEYTQATHIWSSTLTFSPDSDRIAFGTVDGACNIVDVATGRTVVRLPTRPFVSVYAVAFSPDGTRILTSNTRSETRIWDTATGKPVSEFPETSESKGQGSPRYSADGKWLVTWGTQSTHIRDGHTGHPIGAGIPAGRKPAAFSPDSRSVVTADAEGKTRVWDVPSGQPLTEPMRYDSRRLGFPEFSPDGRFIRTENEAEFHVWSVPPRLPDGGTVPDWLLRLAGVCAARVVDENGELIEHPDLITRFSELQRDIAALPVDAPLVDFAHWILDTRAERSIAPGFTITPTEADKLAAVDPAAKP